MCDRLADLLQGEVLALPPDYDPFADEMIVEFAAGPHITAAVRALLPVAADFRPHLVLRAGIEFAGMLVAERLGVPHVAAPTGVGQYTDRLTLLNALNERRAELRLPLHESLDSAHRYGRLDAVPAAYSFARRPMPAAFAYQQSAHHSTGDRLPQWLADLDPAKPLVVAQAAPHVHLAESLPQALLPQAADLLVSHGGYHSIREAVRAGVPVAVLPVLHDQMHNAHRVNELELGVRVQDFTPGAVASACRQAFTSTGIQHSVRRARRHLLGLPSIRAVAGYLERIVQRDRKLVSM
ncbi:hypothetical protein GCM10022267_59460 [Lentzea roselyniae]|uniref:Erythromycin biosynthesis protein CIII-like C-terminal domain-containing protein n=1 Tax=Lentzea roselyniae TaxID=531940 RepID=A0ABP7BNM9_9PSEU